MRITETVKHLIIINFLLWIATLTIGVQEELFNNLFALHFPKNELFKPWQIFTHMFMHASYVPNAAGGMSIYPQHILFNMFALWMFGSPVEQTFGRKKFIFFYISAGLGAALISLGVSYFQYQSGLSDILSLGISPEQIENSFSTGRPPAGISQSGFDTLQEMFNIFRTSMVGASGAIMGVLVAFGMLFPESRLMLIFLPIPIKAKYFIPAIIGLDLISAITGTSFFSPNNTAYVAHLGGAFFGFLMMWYWKRNQFNKNRWD